MAGGSFTSALDGVGGGSSTVYTNTRSSAQTITDFEGIYRQTSNNEVPRDGLYRIDNLLRHSLANPGSQVSGGAIPASWSWQSTAGVTVSAASYGTFADGVEYVQYTITHASGGTNYPLFRFVSALTSIAASERQKVAYRTRMEVTASSAGCRPYMTTYAYTSASGYVTEYSTALVAASTPLADGIYGTATPHTLAGSTIAYAMPAIQIAVPAGGSITIRIANHQMQRVQGASNQVCGDYVNATTTYNAGIPGVRYASKTNANTVDAGTLALTEIEGAAITNAWRGVSVPHAATNNCTYTEDLTAVDWTQDGIVPTNDGTLGPDATGLLQKLTDTTGNVVHSIYRLITGTSQSVAGSFHLKAGGTIPFIRLRVGDTSNNVYVDFNCATMAIAASGVTGAITTLRSVSVVRCGLTDIYRVSVGATASSAIAKTYVVNFCQTVGNTAAYIGTQQYAYFGFAQEEDRESSTPYISNKATGTTSRLANAITTTLPDVSARDLAVIITHRPFYSPSATVKSIAYTLAKIGSVSGDDLKLEAAAGNANILSVKSIASATYSSGSTGLTGVNERTKWGFRLTGNKIRLCVNGTLATEHSNTTAATNDGVLTLATSNSVIERIETYTRTMGDAELQARTTL